MEKTNVLTLIITLVVGVILTGALLGPVISDATETEKTFVNPGVFNYGIFTPDDEYTFTYDANSNTLTANGEPVTVPGVDTTTRASYSILASENVLVRYGATTTYVYLQIVGIDTFGNGISASVSADQTATVTIADGKLQATWGAESTPASRTFDFTELYGIVANESEAVMKVSNEAVYIKGDSPLYASGLTNVTAWNNVFHFEGTYKDGITISSPTFPDATYTNVTWNVEAVDGYLDLYKLNSIEFDINTGDTTVHATYSFFGVPSSVTAEKSQHLTDGQIALMGAIPVMVIVALLMVAVGAIALRRND